jgi:hypothetical protein
MTKLIIFVACFVAFMIYRMFAIYKRKKPIDRVAASRAASEFDEDNVVTDAGFFWHPLNIYNKDR